MKRKLLIVLAIFVSLYGAVTIGYNLNTPQTDVQATTAVLAPSVLESTPEAIPLDSTTIFNLVNEERTKIGLQPLIRDARLDATAQARANDMVARDYFAHRDPVTDRNMVRMNEVITECMNGSENIGMTEAKTGDLNTGTVYWWMRSKPHHDALLRADYTHTGVATSGNKTVQHFCTIK